MTVARINNADWAAYLALIQRAFAPMQTRINPPSSLAQLTADDLAEHAHNELFLAATNDGIPVACMMVSVKPDHLYLAKLAVDPIHQGAGRARAMVAWCTRHAPDFNAQFLRLQTRVELIENHAVFAKLGFVETKRTAHPGFDHPTSITMEHRLWDI